MEFPQHQLRKGDVRSPRGGRTQRTLTILVRRLSSFFLLWALVLGAAAPFAQAQLDGGAEASREYEIKAAYLYNFGRYVQWPPESFPSSEAPLVIGVLGTDPFGALLDEIAQSKRIEGRRILARRFASLTEYRPCHILFVASSASADQTTAAIKMAQGSKILLVGEAPGFAQQGGTINFFLEQNKVRFEINTEAAKREQLKISSKLLSLAKIVGGN